MFKRLFWLVTGAGFGFGSSFWVMRAVRNQVDKLRPTRVAARVGADVRVAVGEGRVAMREREAELRASRQQAIEARTARSNARRQLTTGR